MKSAIQSAKISGKLCANQRETTLFFPKIPVKNTLYHFIPQLPSSKMHMHENEISFLVRKAIFKVYNDLGPGLFESVYEKVLAFELEQLGLSIKTEVPVPLIYKGAKLEAGFRMDILVNDSVIVEVKSVETIAEIHHKQILTYLKLSGLRLGLLVNFNTTKITGSIFRKVNGLV